MLKVSIIIPCYNVEKYISKCLDSILSQSYKNLEIIIIDSSTDSTYNIIKRYITKYNKIKYFFQKSNGPSPARNYGINMSTGEYIVFLDSDDILFKDSIEKRVRKIESDCELGLVYTDAFLILEEELLEQKYKNKKVEFFEGYIFLQLLNYNFICNSTVLLRKEVLKDCGILNENLKCVEDYELWLRISRKYKIGYIDEPLTYYRIRKGSLSDDNLSQVETLIKIFNKLRNNVENVEEKKLILKNIEKFHIDLFTIKVKSSLLTKEYSNARMYYSKIFKYNKINVKYYLIYLNIIIFPQSLRFFLKRKKNQREINY